MGIKKKVLLMGALTSLCFSGCGGNTGGGGGDAFWPKDYIEHPNRSATENSFCNLVGEDALGRKLERVGELKKNNRLVGVFYSAWLGQHPESQKGVYNITYLEQTEEGRTALFNADTNNKLSPVGEFHLWGEPLYGYYNMRDPWVVARHMELFIQSGVDYICIDTTNSIVYKDSITNILETLLKFQNQGFDVPKVMFYTNTKSGTTVEILYNTFYLNSKYNSLWMRLDGNKPSIAGTTIYNGGSSDMVYDASYAEQGLLSYIADKYMNFFDVKESQWPNTPYKNPNGLPWMDWGYPQYNHNGIVAVPVAQHSHSKIYVSSKDPECSRGYNNKTYEVDSDWREGQSFQQMWDAAIEDPAVNNVLCTSFNEWMAIKTLNNPGGSNPFITYIDVFDEEYSRDMEMMKGGYGDNFIIQLARNIRKFKVDSFIPYVKECISIYVEDGVSPLWEVVNDEYADLTGEVMPRNFVGITNDYWYIDKSNRNDIKTVKVTSDQDNIYFYVECLNDITERDVNDQTFMNILLRSGNVEKDKDFAGFNYVINRNKLNGNKVSIEKCTGGYNFTSVGEALCTIEGKVMQVSVPRSTIGVNKYNDIEFKITDHITHPEDIMDYYISGESFPLGRLRYAY